MADFKSAIFGEHSGHVRMVVTYWDMAAALVNRGAISLDLFTDANGEHIGVFAKIEPLLGEIRAGFWAAICRSTWKTDRRHTRWPQADGRYARTDESHAGAVGRTKRAGRSAERVRNVRAQHSCVLRFTLV